MDFALRSTAFAHNADIPQRYTCEGDDISPPLSWSGAPQGTQSYALIVEDPDAPDSAAPKRIWVHWVLYNVPSTAAALAENCGPHGGLAGALDGVNDWGKPGYGGPCPPIGGAATCIGCTRSTLRCRTCTGPTKRDCSPR